MFTDLIAQDQFSTKEFCIPVENMSKLVLDIAKLNKKATKLNTKPIRLVLGSVVTKELPRKFPQSPVEFREYQMLTVEGEVPKLPGDWSFAGKLEGHEAGTIVRAIPGQVLPVRFQSANPYHCDHCKKIRTRNATYIVKKEDEYVQVGKSCMKDFLGHADPEKYAAWAEFIYTLEGRVSEYEGGMGGWSTPKFKTIDMIAMAIASINKNGWTPTSSETHIPTAHAVAEQFVPPTGRGSEYFVRLAVVEADYVMAQQVITMIAKRSLTDTSDFIQNLNKFCSVEINSLKTVGYLSAAAMMFLKELNAIEARKSIKDGIVDKSVGPEGTKVTLHCTVISAHRYNRPAYSYYDNGVSQILTMKTTDGALVKMFTTNLNVEKGDEVTLTGKLGASAVETFEKSPFKGITVTQMAPRTRITVLEPTAA